ncbi:MAG: polysaccharide biosynthesis/export family protein [Terriglobales bacterium]
MNLKWRAVIGALVVAGSMAGSLAWAQAALAQAAASPASDGSANAMTAPANTGDPTYVIGAEDVLHIAVWKENDLTATEPVRADGKISLPLLNDVQASGLTPMQLADSLTEKLKKFVADPRVTVVVTAINSKRIYLLGEVSHTGAMPMSPNMTVMQALASAGINQFANTKKIYVLRSENGKKEKFPVNYRKLIKGQDIDHDYTLQPGDTIVVP